MSKWTEQLPEAARDYIGNRRVDEVECIIGDIAGVARGKAMPAAKFAKQTNYFLPNSIFLQTITGEWADNPFDAFTEPDMILEPDWSTATAAPWTADTTLQVIHDAKDQEGNLVPFSPRNVLRRDRKSTRLNSSHVKISYAVFCLKKKKQLKRSGRRHASSAVDRQYTRPAVPCPFAPS